MDIDVLQLNRDIAPPEQRTTKILAYFDSLASPLSTTWSQFVAFRNNINYKVAHNCQVARIEKVLNDRFDPGYHTIYLLNSGGLELIYFSPAIVLDEVYFAPATEAGLEVYFADASLYEGYLGYDFIVMVPAGLISESDEKEMRGLLNYYKLAGKNYRILYY